ncbi:MAG: matrixin family metalloprotease [Accumulibacter sp.]
MARKNINGTDQPEGRPFQLADKQTVEAKDKESTHVYATHHRCKTDGIGFPTPRNQSPLRLVVDATEGFIPLWDKDATLRWRFDEKSFSHFADPAAAKQRIRELVGKAILLWGNAVPIRFAERNDSWDFEISVRNADDCGPTGCVLASAFFPDAGRHELTIYPRMFEQSEHEQLDTIAHELGHVFGLRHFFAKISETAWPSEIFGKHNPFSIMNYGANGEITQDDRSDLQNLYTMVWSKQLTHINGTPIKLVRPFHAS